MVSDEESASDDLPPKVEGSPSTDKPLLASEALMEDLAPREPWRTGARWWSAVAGLVLLGTAVPTWLAAAAPPWVDLAPSLGLGGIALLAGLLPLPYVARGIVMLMAAIAVFGLAVAALGPVASLEARVGSWWLAHAAAAVTLPAALLFRERYRALPRARYLLLVAEALTLAFVAHCALSISAGVFTTQVASGVAIGAVVVSYLGFMGSQAPVAGSLLSAFVLVTVTAQLAVVTTVGAGGGASLTSAGPLVAVAAFAAATLLGALGSAQLLAAASFRHARSIDFRRVKTERPRLTSIASDTWSGHQ